MPRAKIGPKWLLWCLYVCYKMINRYKFLWIWISYVTDLDTHSTLREEIFVFLELQSSFTLQFLSLLFFSSHEIHFPYVHLKYHTHTMCFEYIRKFLFFCMLHKCESWLHLGSKIYVDTFLRHICGRTVYLECLFLQ